MEPPPWEGNSDMNGKRFRGDSAPSDGLGGLEDPNALPGLDGLDGLGAPDRPGMLSTGERGENTGLWGDAGSGMSAGAVRETRSGELLIEIAAS